MRPTLLALLAALLVAGPSAGSGETSLAPDDLATTARRLAGLDPGAGPAWAEHAEALEDAWETLEERHFGPMRAWSAGTLAERLPDGPAPLLYPFGGPDLLSALVLYPEATSWTLIGLEPPGRVADPDALSEEELARELAGLRGALGPIVDAGYFVKKWMEADLDSEAFEGILPVLLVFLAREELEPLEVEAVAPGPGGALRPAAPGRGVRLRVRGPDERVRDVVYLRQDLSDAALAEAPGVVTWLDDLAPHDTWIKAGHYLLHESGFAGLRDLLFAGSRSLLQDDSAIPWRHFEPARWELTLFGEYDAVLPVYREYFQPELAAAYAARAAGPLPFRIGYHAEMGGGPLILAVARDGGDGSRTGSE